MNCDVTWDATLMVRQENWSALWVPASHSSYWFNAVRFIGNASFLSSLCLNRGAPFAERQLTVNLHAATT